MNRECLLNKNEMANKSNLKHNKNSKQNIRRLNKQIHKITYLKLKQEESLHSLYAHCVYNKSLNQSEKRLIKIFKWKLGKTGSSYNNNISTLRYDLESKQM